MCAADPMDLQWDLLVISGPMFSGKTESLIDWAELMQGDFGYLIRSFRAEPVGRSAKIQSHNGRTLQLDQRLGCEPFPHPEKLAEAVFTPPWLGMRLVVVDNVHFLDMRAARAIEALADHDRTKVVVAGLDTDFRGVDYPVTDHFLQIADALEELTAQCAMCFGESVFLNPATRTVRIVPDDSLILVGGSAYYEPRCDYHAREYPVHPGTTDPCLSASEEAG